MAERVHPGDVRSDFEQLGYALPERIRASCSWPSKTAYQQEARIGEAWSAKNSADQSCEVFISPVLKDRWKSPPRWSMNWSTAPWVWKRDTRASFPHLRAGALSRSRTPTRQGDRTKSGNPAAAADISCRVNMPGVLLLSETSRAASSGV